MKLFLILQIYSVSLYLMTISKILIPDVTRLYHLQEKYAKTVFWKVCVRCEHKSLINSEQYWL